MIADLDLQFEEIGNDTNESDPHQSEIIIQVFEVDQQVICNLFVQMPQAEYDNLVKSWGPLKQVNPSIKKEGSEKKYSPIRPFMGRIEYISGDFALVIGQTLGKKIQRFIPCKFLSNVL